MGLDMLINVCHRNRYRLVQLLDLLVACLKLTLNATNSQLEEFVLPLGLNYLCLQEVLVLFEGLGSGHPVFDLFVELLFLGFHFDSLLIEAVHFLIELVDGFILESVVAIFCI